MASQSASNAIDGDESDVSLQMSSASSTPMDAEEATPAQGGEANANRDQHYRPGGNGTAPTSKKRKRQAYPDPDEEIEDDTKWTKGSFNIISSDGIRFRIHAYHIMSASKVFRQAAKATRGEHVVHLADPDHENANVIRRFLSLITNGTPGEDVKDDHLATVKGLLHLVDFLKKYDCKAGLEAMRKHARYQTRPDPLGAFILAANLDDGITCADALRLAPSHKCAWSTLYRENNPETGVAGYCELQPGAMPQTMWQLIPSKYSFLLARSWLSVDCEECSMNMGEEVRTRGDMADMFETLLKKIEGEPVKAPAATTIA